MRIAWRIRGAVCIALATLAACASRNAKEPQPIPAPAPAEAQPSDTAPPEAEALDPGPEAAFAVLLAGMNIGYDPGAGRVSASGWVNMREGLIEVFACTPEGKTHEAVVTLDCVPSGLHAGLLALGLQAGQPVEAGTGDEYRAPTGDGVIVECEWTDETGAVQRARAEDWIWHAGEERPMVHAPWIFAGSFVQPALDEGGAGTYAADYVKSLVTTYHDASSVLENPFADGADDTLYYVNEKAVPAVGTPVMVYFSAAASGSNNDGDGQGGER